MDPGGLVKGKEAIIILKHVLSSHPPQSSVRWENGPRSVRLDQYFTRRPRKGRFSLCAGERIGNCGSTMSGDIL